MYWCIRYIFRRCPEARVRFCSGPTVVGDNDRLGFKKLGRPIQLVPANYSPSSEGTNNTHPRFFQTVPPAPTWTGCPRIWACPTFSALGAITTPVVFVFGMTDGTEGKMLKTG